MAISSVGGLKLGDNFKDEDGFVYTVISFPTRSSVCGHRKANMGEPSGCKLSISRVKKVERK